MTVQELQLVDDEVAHGEHVVQVPGRLHQRMLVVVVHRRENVFQVPPLARSLVEHVVEHRVVAGEVLDNRPDRRHLVGVEHRSGVALHVELSLEGGGHAHVLVGQQQDRLGRSVAAEALERLDAGLCQANVLLEVPDALELLGWNAELLEQLALEKVQTLLIVVEYVKQQDLGGHLLAGVGVVHHPLAVHDAHVVAAMNGAELVGPFSRLDAVDGAVEHLALDTQALVGGLVGAEQRPQENGPADFLLVRFCGHQAGDYRPDTADLLDRFMGYVHYDHRVGFLLVWRPGAAWPLCESYRQDGGDLVADSPPGRESCWPAPLPSV